MTRMNTRILRPVALVAALLAVASMVLAFKPRPTGVELVRERGELVVVTRHAPTTFYRNQHGPTGFEYELAEAFAGDLGVELRVITRETIGGVLDAVRSGEADLAAAGLTVTDDRRERVTFSTPYQKIREKVVYRMDEPRPESPADLQGKDVVVLAESSHAERLRPLAGKHNFDLTRVEGASAEKLMTLVDQKKFDYTVVDSNAFKMNRALFPELASAFELGEPRPLAWAFASGAEDNSLYRAAQRYITRRKAQGYIARLRDRFYGHADQFNLYAARSFIDHLYDRLPRYADVFREAAQKHDLDWRLVAAMGYQESLWQKDAVSPTGVRGLMMLTRNTARHMGIQDRTDPEQSIRAGAAYLRQLLDRLPDRIPEPDRTWMAVAAYNVGLGHVEDARKITEYQGDDPDAWADVRERLPLLKKPDYYRYTRHGYARSGAQSVLYVKHVQRYYDQLVWAEASERHGGRLVASAE
jgi:membrane-bound lytic murein transglycosylase F